MAWKGTKTDWAGGNIPTAADVNRWEENTKFLYDNVPFVYKCNGVNDNVQLSNICNQFFTDGSIPNTAVKTVYINGTLKITNTPSAGTGTSANPSRWFDFSPGTSGKKIIFDFGNAVIPPFTYSNSSSGHYVHLFNVSNNSVMIKNCTVNFTMQECTSFIGFSGNGVFRNCIANLNGSMSGSFDTTGFHGNGEYIGCIANITGSGSGFVGNGMYINCTGRAPGASGTSYAFNGGGNYTNCKGYSNVGFNCTNSSSQYINCRGEGSTASGWAYGFTGSGIFTNCIGIADGSPGGGIGFESKSMICNNCIGLGIQFGSAPASYGFKTFDNSSDMVLNCCLAPIKSFPSNNTGIWVTPSTNGNIFVTGCRVDREYGINMNGNVNRTGNNAQGAIYVGNNMTSQTFTMNL